MTRLGQYRSPALGFLHLPIFRPYTLIEFFHHADEGNIFMPEWWIVSLLLNQNRWDADWDVLASGAGSLFAPVQNAL